MQTLYLKHEWIDRLVDRNVDPKDAKQLWSQGKDHHGNQYQHALDEKGDKVLVVPQPRQVGKANAVKKVTQVGRKTAQIDGRDASHKLLKASGLKRMVGHIEDVESGNENDSKGGKLIISHFRNISHNNQTKYCFQTFFKLYILQNIMLPSEVL